MLFGSVDTYNISDPDEQDAGLTVVRVVHIFFNLGNAARVRWSITSVSYPLAKCWSIVFSSCSEATHMCVRVVQSDCTIHNVGHEFPGNCGITAFYSRGLRLLHNEIYDIPYTGISVGWGWNFAQRKTWPRMP